MQQRVTGSLLGHHLLWAIAVRLRLYAQQRCHEVVQERTRRLQHDYGQALGQVRGAPDEPDEP